MTCTAVYTSIIIKIYKYRYKGTPEYCRLDFFFRFTENRVEWYFLFFFLEMQQTKRLSKRQFICNSVLRRRAVVVWVVGEIDQPLPIKSFETIISSYASGIFSTIKYNFLNKLYGQIAKTQSKQTLTVKTCNNKCLFLN